MKNTKFIKNVSFQLCSVPDSEGLVLEVLDENKVELLEIRIDDKDVEWVHLFSSDGYIALPLKDLESAIEIAKKEVVEKGEFTIAQHKET